jgi:hypothetical protein
MKKMNHNEEVTDKIVKLSGPLQLEVDAKYLELNAEEKELSNEQR